MNAQEIRAAISLAIVYVLRMLGLFMVIPVIAIAATEFPDYSALLVGVAIGGYGLTQAILQIPMGVLSDRWGRKPVIYMGLTFFAAGSVLAASADSMLMLTLGRILQGAGAIAGAVMALAADVTRESQRAKVMAIIGVSIGFSFYIALLAGPMVAGTYGLQGIFWLTSVLALLCLPLVKWGVQSPRVMAPSGDSLPKLSQLSALYRDPQLWRLNISVLMVHLLITCFFVQVPSMLVAAGFSLDQQWQIYAPVLLLSVLLLVIVMRATSQSKSSFAFLLSLGFMALAFGLFLWGNLAWWGLLTAAVLFFAGFNYMEAYMPALVSSLAPAGKKGSAMGIYASHQFFGAFLGGVLSGALNQWFDAQLSFVLCLAVLLLLAFVVKDLASANKTKRITLHAPSFADGLNADSEQHLYAELITVEGVEEVNFDSSEHAIYLKVDKALFDLEQAQLTLERFSHQPATT